MKKCLLICLALLTLCGVLFAEDANVLPGRVGRIYTIPVYRFYDGAYDGDGKYAAYAGGGAMKAFILAFAVEYGVNDWITAAVQWTPALAAWSDVDTALGIPSGQWSSYPGGLASSSSVNGNGLADIFVGAKIQFIGEKAPIKNDMFHVAVAPGIIVPLPGPDYQKMFNNMLANNAVTAQNVDNHVFGLGARFWVDFFLENFVTHLYSEFKYYPVKGKISDRSFQDYLQLQIYNAAISTAGASQKDEVDYGYNLTVELEPVYSFKNLGPGKLGVGAALNYVLNPGVKYGGINNPGNVPGLTALSPFADPGISQRLRISPNVGYTIANETLSVEGKVSYLADAYQTDDKLQHRIKPEVNVFLYKTFLPIEIKARYEIPVWGKNAPAQHQMDLELRFYLKI
jgi:hypothetical protein